FPSLAIALLPLSWLVGCTQPAETGKLEFRANGEDFVRQGFTTKDGWQIDFDHAYLTLSDITAYQSDPPFDATRDAAPVADKSVGITRAITVDLAEGDETAAPILIETVDAPAGRFNALSWKLAATEAPLVLIGTATKANRTVPFEIALSPALTFTCGDFVGDQRKGILAAGETAEVEATFHFDHLFGDADLPADDELNQGALGFEPLAAIAAEDRLALEEADLQQQLSPANYQKLQKIYQGLGHVGEGHCAASEVNR
ncbi:MAG: DUF4382 domain-containing protein, partial [Leptolyngbya sp. SIO4C1]|nr:DUF4382 domain-containing protein [Leptolyngbya sp. SIO4C1]